MFAADTTPGCADRDQDDQHPPRDAQFPADRRTLHLTDHPGKIMI
jgi:hypothetical protein